MNNIGISLVISFYKRIDFLYLIFLSLEKQSNKNFEVIIAEDADDIKTIAFLEKARQKFSFSIIHLSQKDEGFQKNKMLNKAIIAAKNENIVFIDGDCVLHKHFIKEYALQLKPNTALCGRKSELSEKLTNKLIINQSLSKLSLLSMVLYKCYRIEDAFYFPFILCRFKKNKGMIGCNWGTQKKLLLQVNGYDENYKMPCVGEDVDIEWRLKQIGVNFKSIENQAIVYHLYHKANYKENAYKENMKILQKTKENNQFYAINGIIKK